MDSEDVERMIVEIVTAKPPAKPDTPEMLRMRQQLVKEIQAIQADGLDVDTPHEIPSGQLSKLVDEDDSSGIPDFDPVDEPGPPG